MFLFIFFLYSLSSLKMGLNVMSLNKVCANRWNSVINILSTIIISNQYINTKRLAFQVQSVLCKPSCWFRSNICHFYKVRMQRSINCTKQVLSTGKFTGPQRSEMCICYLKKPLKNIIWVPAQHSNKWKDTIKMGKQFGIMIKSPRFDLDRNVCEFQSGLFSTV